MFRKSVIFFDKMAVLIIIYTLTSRATSLCVCNYQGCVFVDSLLYYYEILFFVPHLSLICCILVRHQAAFVVIKIAIKAEHLLKDL